jgi:predicted lipid carrier protein YhbT
MEVQVVEVVEVVETQLTQVVMVILLPQVRRKETMEEQVVTIQECLWLAVEVEELTLLDLIFVQVKEVQVVRDLQMILQEVQ